MPRRNSTNDEAGNNDEVRGSRTRNGRNNNNASSSTAVAASSSSTAHLETTPIVTINLGIDPSNPSAATITATTTATTTAARRSGRRRNQPIRMDEEEPRPLPASSNTTTRSRNTTTRSTRVTAATAVRNRRIPVTARPSTGGPRGGARGGASRSTIDAVDSLASFAAMLNDSMHGYRPLPRSEEMDFFPMGYGNLRFEATDSSISSSEDSDNNLWDFFEGFGPRQPTEKMDNFVAYGCEMDLLQIILGGGSLSDLQHPSFDYIDGLDKNVVRRVFLEAAAILITESAPNQSHLRDILAAAKRLYQQCSPPDTLLVSASKISAVWRDGNTTMGSAEMVQQALLGLTALLFFGSQHPHSPRQESLIFITQQVVSALLENGVSNCVRQAFRTTLNLPTHPYKHMSDLEIIKFVFNMIDKTLMEASSFRSNQVSLLQMAPPVPTEISKFAHQDPEIRVNAKNRSEKVVKSGPSFVQHVVGKDSVFSLVSSSSNVFALPGPNVFYYEFEIRAADPLNNISYSIVISEDPVAYYGQRNSGTPTNIPALEITMFSSGGVMVVANQTEDVLTSFHFDINTQPPYRMGLGLIIPSLQASKDLVIDSTYRFFVCQNRELKFAREFHLPNLRSVHPMLNRFRSGDKKVSISGCIGTQFKSEFIFDPSGEKWNVPGSMSVDLMREGNWAPNFWKTFHTEKKSPKWRLCSMLSCASILLEMVPDQHPKQQWSQLDGIIESNQIQQQQQQQQQQQRKDNFESSQPKRLRSCNVTGNGLPPSPTAMLRLTRTCSVDSSLSRSKANNGGASSSNCDAGTISSNSSLCDHATPVSNSVSSSLLHLPSLPSASSASSTSASLLSSAYEDQVPMFVRFQCRLRGLSMLLGDFVKEDSWMLRGHTSPLGFLVERFGRSMELDVKIEWFSQKAQELPFVNSDVMVRVRRGSLVEDTLYKNNFWISSSPPETGVNIRGLKIRVQFANEIGTDTGGLTTEWLRIFFSEIVDPLKEKVLFRSLENGTVFLNQWSNIPAKYRNATVFEETGIIIGWSIFRRLTIPIRFHPALCRHILQDLRFTVRDLMSVNAMYGNITKCLLEGTVPSQGGQLSLVNDNNATVLDWLKTVLHDEITFSVTDENSVIDLPLPSAPEYQGKRGRDVLVTESNKLDYVTAVIHHFMVSSISQPLEALLRGIYAVIPRSFFRSFGDAELQRIIGGQDGIDVSVWQLVTNCSAISSQQANWFWEILHGMSEEDRWTLLSFWTARRTLPVFGMEAIRPPLTITLDTSSRQANDTRLPSAHTCQNQLVMPIYSSSQIMERQLRIAISLPMEFGFV